MSDTRVLKSTENLSVHDHLCLIYENQKEQFDAVIPFIRIGLSKGEKCIYIADDNTADQVLGAMRADGIDVESALSKGALVIATKKETYLKQGYFDPDGMIQFLKVTTDSAIKDGFTALRVTGEMTWVLGKDPGTMRLMEYESKLNHFLPGNECLAICQYNKNRFSPEIIKDVIYTHPLVIAGGFVCRNFYYIPPEEFLEKEKGSLEVERLLSNLIDREKAEENFRQAQKALDHQYAEKSEIFNAIGHMTLLLDPKHNILAANRAAVTGLGKTEEELRGKKCYELFHGTTRPPESCPLEKMLLSNSMETSEMVVEALNGVYLASCTPIFDEKGNLEKVIHITTDITQRKQAEEALQESQSRFSSIYQQSPMAIELYDSKGLLIDANPKCLEMFGVSDIRKIIGFKLFDDPNITDDLKRKISLGEAVKFESEFDFDIVKKMGLYETSRSGRIYIECTVSPWEIEDAQKGYLVHITDITQRKQAEEALRRSEMELNESQRVAQVGSWKWIIASDTIAWSPGYYRIIGRDLSLPPPNYTEHLKMYTQESAARLEAAVAETLKKGTPYELDMELLHPDGTRRLMVARGEAIRDAAGQVAMLRGTLQDITQRKRAEEALSCSEVKLKKAQHYAHMGSWAWNIKTGKLEWSDEMFHLFGINKETFSGSLPEVIAQAIHPEDRAKVEQSNLSVITEKKPIPLEYRVIWPDKSVHVLWAEAGELLLDEAGNPRLLSGIVQDITERKKTEEELKKHREHLEELVKERTAQLNQKNEELERFNRLFVGRELRMIELKKRIAELEKKIGSPGDTKRT